MQKVLQVGRQEAILMDFDDANLVIMNTLNKEEAKAFVLFLASEILRHRDDILTAKSLARAVAYKFGITAPEVIESIYGVVDSNE